MSDCVAYRMLMFGNDDDFEFSVAYQTLSNDSLTTATPLAPPS